MVKTDNDVDGRGETIDGSHSKRCTAGWMVVAYFAIVISNWMVTCYAYGQSFT